MYIMYRKLYNESCYKWIIDLYCCKQLICWTLGWCHLFHIFHYTQTHTLIPTRCHFVRYDKIWQIFEQHCTHHCSSTLCLWYEDVGVTASEIFPIRFCTIEYPCEIKEITDLFIFSAIKLNQMKYEYLNVYTLFTVYYIFPILSKLHVVFLDRYRCKQNLAIKSLVNLYTNSYYWIHRWQNIWEYWVES